MSPLGEEMTLWQVGLSLLVAVLVIVAWDVFRAWQRGEFSGEQVTHSVDPLWLKIQALERACWSRKWSDIKRARKAIEADLGKRPPATLAFKE